MKDPKHNNTIERNLAGRKDLSDVERRILSAWNSDDPKHHSTQKIANRVGISRSYCHKMLTILCSKGILIHCLKDLQNKLGGTYRVSCYSWNSNMLEDSHCSSLGSNRNNEDSHCSSLGSNRTPNPSLKERKKKEKKEIKMATDNSKLNDTEKITRLRYGRLIAAFPGSWALEIKILVRQDAQALKTDEPWLDWVKKLTSCRMDDPVKWEEELDWQASAGIDPVISQAPPPLTKEEKAKLAAEEQARLDAEELAEYPVIDLDKWVS